MGRVFCAVESLAGNQKLNLVALETVNRMLSRSSYLDR